MMTLDEIRHVEFTRGRGYRAEEVDDFIDECVETLEQYRKENEEATQKMKMLADKLAEYRNEEDSIRAALLNAQRAGDTALREAEEKAVAGQAGAEARSVREPEEGAPTPCQDQFAGEETGVGGDLLNLTRCILQTQLLDHGRN